MASDSHFTLGARDQRHGASRGTQNTISSIARSKPSEADLEDPTQEVALSSTTEASRFIFSDRKNIIGDKKAQFEDSLPGTLDVENDIHKKDKKELFDDFANQRSVMTGTIGKLTLEKTHKGGLKKWENMHLRRNSLEDMHRVLII